jgi:hypothetical protein
MNGRREMNFSGKKEGATVLQCSECDAIINRTAFLREGSPCNQMNDKKKCPGTFKLVTLEVTAENS